jgi:hypothetical protein
LFRRWPVATTAVPRSRIRAEYALTPLGSDFSVARNQFSRNADTVTVRRPGNHTTLEGCSSDLEHLNPIIKTHGTESSIMESHQAGAAAGHTFPDRLRAVRTGYGPADECRPPRRVITAHKYNRFSFAEL